MCKFTTTSGKTVFLPQVGYHMPNSTVWMFSPQSFLRSFGGHCKLSGHMATIYLQNGDSVEFRIYQATNLPMYHGCSCTSAEKHAHGQRFCRDLHGHVLMDLLSCTNTSSMEHGCSHSCCSYVAEESNQNLSSAQKELLQWHWKLCINMRQVQQLMKPREYRDLKGAVHQLSPIIQPKFKSTPFCDPPKCM